MSSLEYEKIKRHSFVPFEKAWCFTPCFIWTNSPLADNVASLFDSGQCILVEYVAVVIVAVIISIVNSDVVVSGVVPVIVSVVVSIIVAVIVTIAVA
eukprot:5718980-Ditylum_brightwellii.AAC.1